MPIESLTNRVLRGSAWSTFATLGERALGFARTVVLARVLLPDDFGIVGIALTIAGGLEAFTTSGLQAAIVQRKDTTKEVLETAWTLTVLRGLLLALVLFSAAEPAARFFEEPAVAAIMRFLALNQVLAGLSNIGVVLLQKDMDFKRRTIFDLASGGLTTIVSITAALLLRNYWALVIGEMSGAIIRCILSYVVHEYRPRLRWDRELASELFSFGKHIMVFRMMDFLLISGDDLFVGKVLGKEALGYYGLAYQVSNLPATLISRSVTRVLFPALSKLQDDTAALAGAYTRTIEMVALLSVPAGGWAALHADAITRVCFGEEWLPMTPVMRVLCLYGTLRSIGYTCGPLFQSIGRPDVLRNISALQLLFVALSIWPLTVSFGLPGAALSITGGILIWNVSSSILAGRHLGVSQFLLLRPVAGSVFVSVVALGAAYALSGYLSADSLSTLALSGIGFGMAYIGCTAVLQPRLFREVRSLITQSRT